MPCSGKSFLVRRLWSIALAFLAIISYAGCRSAGVMAPVAAKFDAYLRAREARQDFSGTVIVESRGTVLLDRGYGKSDYELGTPNDDAKIYRIGSLSKPFTALAVMRLEEEGRLSIEDRVCKYLRECPASWNEVTLSQLLSHTSGIPDDFEDVEAGPLSAMRELIDKVVHEKLATPLATPPGVEYQYSNFGYLLLGYVCEVAAKQPWEDVLRTRIFEPAGMTATGYDDVFAIVPGRARGYAHRNRELRNIVYKDHGAFAAGGLRSTARDLLSFVHALMAGRIVRLATLEKMFTSVLDNYGLGWQSMNLFGRRVVDHTGEIDGFASHLVMYRDDDLVIIVLSNFEDEPAKITACDLARIDFGLPDTFLGDVPAAEGLPAAKFNAYVGEFVDGERTRRIERRGDRLVYVASAGKEIPLEPAGVDTFHLGRMATLRFAADGDSFTLTDGCGVRFSTMKRVATPH